MKVTIDQVMAWKPCFNYPRERIEKLWSGAYSLSALDILDLDIPDKDKVWAICHEDLTAKPVLHEIWCRIAEAALTNDRLCGRETDDRSWNAITVKRAWLRGEASNEDLALAREAAKEAEYSESGSGGGWNATNAAAYVAETGLLSSIDAEWVAIYLVEHLVGFDLLLKIIRDALCDAFIEELDDRV